MSDQVEVESVLVNVPVDGVQNISMNVVQCTYCLGFFAVDSDYLAMAHKTVCCPMCQTEITVKESTKDHPFLFRK